MRALVTLKGVPEPTAVDPSIAVALASGEGREAVHRVVNGYDLHALEAALRITEAVGGTVVAVTVGPTWARDVPRYALAMGAATATHVVTPEEPDAAWTAKLLAAAIRRSGPVDLVLGGRQASDSDGGEVLYRVAAELGIAVLGPVVAVEDVTPEAARCRILSGGAVSRARLTMPGVLSVSSEANGPRLPPISGRIRAARADLTTWSSDELGVPRPAAGWGVRRVYRASRRSRAELVGLGADDATAGRLLADRLLDEGWV